MITEQTLINSISDPVSNTGCKIAGWGRLTSEDKNNAPYPSRLYEADVAIKEREECLAGIYYQS